MKRFIAVISFALVSLLTIVSFTACSGNFRFLKDSEVKDLPNPTGKIYICVYNDETGETLVEDQVFGFELFYKEAPNTVSSFIKLVNDKYYDGLSFDLASNNQPFVIFGQNEFYKDDQTNDKGVVTSTSYYEKLVDSTFHIIGEFSDNGWNKNTSTAGVGSMMMSLNSTFTTSATKKSDYNTAYAPFIIQYDANSTRVAYEKYNCVFGKIISLPNGAYSSSGLHGELVDNLFTNSEYSSSYSTENRIKFMITKIEMDDNGKTYPAPLRVKV